LTGSPPPADDTRMSVTVRALPNGPLMVRGEYVVQDSRGVATAGNGTVLLCRCGNSEKKPFCDGSHKRVGFTDKD
jgi:CDGSH-type Zn-finger protein